MSIENFRSLGTDAQESCEKVKEKIQLLEEERSFSLVVLLEGVAKE